jgi:hypothetical protein
MPPHERGCLSGTDTGSAYSELLSKADRGRLCDASPTIRQIEVRPNGVLWGKNETSEYALLPSQIEHHGILSFRITFFWRGFNIFVYIIY